MLIEKDYSGILLIDVQTKLLPLIHEADNLLKNISWLLSLAQFLEVPCTATEQYPTGLGPTVPALQALLPAKPMAKVAFSVLADQAIADVLAADPVQDLIVVGIETHVCILQSVVELLETERNIYVVADCVGARNPRDHELALARMQHLGAEIVSKEMVLFEWLRQAGTEQFKTISKQFLQ